MLTSTAILMLGACLPSTETADTVQVEPPWTYEGTQPAEPTSLPEFSATASDGTGRTWPNLHGHRNLLWFHADRTSGSSIAAALRDSTSRMQALDLTATGINAQSPSDNATWLTDEALGFELWTDDGRELSMHYGAADGPWQEDLAHIAIITDDRGNSVIEYRGDPVSGPDLEVVFADLELMWGPP